MLCVLGGGGGVRVANDYLYLFFFKAMMICQEILNLKEEVYFVRYSGD